MENMMQTAWDFIWNHLYDDCTGMHYNHLAGDAARASQYLPEPDLIRLLIERYNDLLGKNYVTYYAHITNLNPQHTVIVNDNEMVVDNQ